NPQVATITHRHAGRIAFYFAPELVRRLKPNRTRTDDRLSHQPNHSFFLKIGLGRPVLSNRCEKTLQLRLRKRPAARDRCQCDDEKNRQQDGAHALSLCDQLNFFKAEQPTHAVCEEKTWRVLTAISALTDGNRFAGCARASSE